eukprot:6198970-Pleurochrysis_carterae.AAC.2
MGNFSRPRQELFAALPGLSRLQSNSGLAHDLSDQFDLGLKRFVSCRRFKCPRADPPRACA